MKDIFTDNTGIRYIIRKNGKRYYEKDCLYCRTPFFPRREGQKYCSQSCNVRACKKRNNYPINLKPKVIEERGESIESKLQEISNNSKIKKSEIVTSTMLGHAAYDTVKGLGKSLFNIKSQLEREVSEIKEDVKQVRKEIVENSKLTPTGIKTKVLTLQDSKIATMVEYKNQKGELFYRVESLEDSNYFPVNF